MSRTELPMPYVLIYQDVDGAFTFYPCRSLKDARHGIEDLCAEFAREEYNWTVTDDPYHSLSAREVDAILEDMRTYDIFVTLMPVSHLFGMHVPLLKSRHRPADRSTRIIRDQPNTGRRLAVA